MLQLTGLLNSTDHAGVVDRKDGRIFTQAELDALLDRSDLKNDCILVKDKYFRERM